VQYTVIQYIMRKVTSNKKNHIYIQSLLQCIMLLYIIYIIIMLLCYKQCLSIYLSDLYKVTKISNKPVTSNKNEDRPPNINI